MRVARKTSGHQRELITTPDKILFKVHQLGETKVLQALQKRQITTRIEFQSRIPENRPREPRKSGAHLIYSYGGGTNGEGPPSTTHQHPIFKVPPNGKGRGFRPQRPIILIRYLRVQLF